MYIRRRTCRCTSMNLSAMVGGGGSSGEVGASEAASLVLRIATVGLSLASVIMTAASTQCTYRDGVAAGTVSYGDYASFKYAALADLVSAALQGVAIYLEATGNKENKAAKAAVELIDKVVQALTSSSAALLLAVDDITSCGGGGAGPRQRGSGLCGGRAGAFCGRVRVSSALSIAATVSVAGSLYTRHVAPAAGEVVAPRPARTPSPPPQDVEVERKDDEGGKKEKEEEVEKRKVQLIVMEKTEEEVKKKGKDGKDKQEEKKEDEVDKVDEQCCGGGTEVSTPPVMLPPWCRCPRLTIPCNCEDPELCSAFF